MRPGNDDQTTSNACWCWRWCFLNALIANFRFFGRNMRQRAIYIPLRIIIETAIIKLSTTRTSGQCGLFHFNALLC
ncbi:hypothetical protein I7I48_08086 [Histoplasma ohiense]|nr:hypothetical protein I7I48_08086 [Histoplasma ohiense (nom. inval.)]